MALKRRKVATKLPNAPSSNVSSKSLDVLKAKISHQLHVNKKKLVIPQNKSWDDLKESNIWITPIENEVKSIFNVRSIPCLDNYAQELIHQSQK